MAAAFCAEKKSNKIATRHHARMYTLDVRSDAAPVSRVWRGWASSAESFNSSRSTYRAGFA